MENLSQEQIEEKAAELSSKYDNKVTPIVMTDDGGNQIVGYFQEPSYDVRMYLTDCYVNKELSKAYEAALRDTLIVEDSNVRILSSSRKDAKIRASFVIGISKMLAPMLDEYKKK